MQFVVPIIWRNKFPSKYFSKFLGDTRIFQDWKYFINQCIEGCDIQRITKLSDSIDNLDPFSEERDAFAATILGGAMQLSIDGDGRVILPESLIAKSEIDKKALFVGKGPTFEIWNPDRFDQYLINAKRQAKEKRNMLRLNPKCDSN